MLYYIIETGVEYLTHMLDLITALAIYGGAYISLIVCQNSPDDCPPQTCDD